MRLRTEIKEKFNKLRKKFRVACNQCQEVKQQKKGFPKFPLQPMCATRKERKHLTALECKSFQ